ncbi:crossover junction endodeoxyribonuclease RuvC [Gordonia sp. X0973]|uniref:crossover junction endodeoxyribonuclease RuvC n=1 Tax=Gordonia sp. X0973 TaxID=2742602 RepID=UPI000F534B0A|nr:crossover junction endodeoxyribonuclease RuvC [Gordonia sp. X0973]QKT07255.1 crossover junction endodeoxyribonuclease RuvC [Gordonia sp. X0973]
MRVMGVDPGLTRCGIALVESGAGRAVTALDVDVVRTPPTMDLADRLLAVHTAAVHWLDTHRPEVVAIERVFAQQQVSTAMGTAQAAGVVALAAAQRDIPVRFHTPSEVKAAVTGSGRADKAQVTTMVTRILGMQTRPKPADAADALALAICQCWRGPMDDRIVAAQAKAQELARAHRAKLKAAHAAALEARR